MSQEGTMIRLIILTILLLSSCGDHSSPVENQGDIYKDNNSSYVITLYNHPALYGEKNCFLCHQEFSIHKEDRIQGQGIDLELIQNMVKESGVQSCKMCHGDNDL